MACLHLPGLQPRSNVRRLLASVAMLAFLAIPTPVAAAGSTWYVDGKAGSDANDGRTPSNAFRTIHRAADAIPLGSAAAGSRVIVHGYSDYVYRERPISPGWNRAGAVGSPIVFAAAGYVAGGTGYVKPIVSGADPAPAAGFEWEPAGTSGVWRTEWVTAPFDFGRGLDTVVFQDETRWLWERDSLAELASAAQDGTGGYFYSSGWLYAAPLGTAATEPHGHAFDVVTRNAFYFKGDQGTSRVEVRGFEVRHAANGIAFKAGVDAAVAADNLLVGNLYMGIQVSGNDSGSARDPATGNTVSRNVFVANTLQGIKIDRGTQSSTFCDNDISGSGLAGIKLQGAPSGMANLLVTRNNTVCRNNLHDNTSNPTGSPYANTSGMTIANGARSNTISGNRIYRNLVGIHVTQEGKGRLSLQGNVLKWNAISANSRYGIYFYDGMYGNGNGEVKSIHDLIWGNGIGVRVDRGSTNKVLRFDTVYHNNGDGVRVGLSGGTTAKVLIQRSLITHNAGYGIDARGASRGVLSHVGIAGNKAGAIRGHVGTAALNKWAPKYLSRTAGDAGFLRISRASREYTAGPHRTPIGARW